MNLTKNRSIWLAALVAATILVGCTRDPNVLKQKHFARGESYFQHAQYREAAIEFQNAIQIDPKYAEAHYELAQTYLKEADWLHAYQELMKTVEINPNNLKAQLDLADLLLAAGKIPDARKSRRNRIAERTAKCTSTNNHFPCGRRSRRSQQGRK